jgi:hypothetical protein
MVDRDLSVYVELLKRTPYLDRSELLENLKRSQGLTQDQCLIITLKAENRSDSEIEEERRKIKEEKESDAIFKRLNEFSPSNPSGSAGDENPLVKMAKMGQLVNSGKSAKESFIEVFGQESYEEIVKDLR